MSRFCRFTAERGIVEAHLLISLRLNVAIEKRQNQYCATLVGVTSALAPLVERRRRKSDIPPAVGFRRFLPLCLNRFKRVFWVIKRPLRLLAPALRLPFAGKFAGTCFDRFMRLSQYGERQRRRFKSDAMVKKESGKCSSRGPVAMQNFSCARRSAVHR